MKISDLKAGDRVQADGGFTCVAEGSVLLLHDDDGLFFECCEDHHYLEGQVGEDDELVGLSKV